MKVKHYLLIMMIFCLMCFFSNDTRKTAAADSPISVKRTSERTVMADMETQKVMDAWDEEERILLKEIEESERSLKNIKWEQKKTLNYIQTLESKVAALKEKAQAMQNINAQLLPVLDETLNRLKLFVASDMPFDRAARMKQIEETEQILNDYDAGILNKTQSLLEAVAKEVAFGYGVNALESNVDIDGYSVCVTLLKVGRVGLFALTLDSRKAWEWKADQNRYLPSNHYIEEINKAIEMVQGIRMVELARLPLGQPMSGATLKGEGSND